MNLKEVLQSAYEAKASDIHFMPGAPVMFRINGTMSVYAEEAMRLADMEELLHEMLTKMQRKELDGSGEFETAVTVYDSFRIRINIYRQQGTYAAAIHILTLKIPSPEELLLPLCVLAAAKERKGLILIAGEAGCGKTTTAACMLNQIAANEAKNIITIEHPVEYLLPRGRGMISQREVGNDVGGYAEAVRACMHQDPDIIFIGTLQDAETISEAIMAAESGRLVFALAHAVCTEHLLRQMTGCFLPDQKEEMQRRLADVLKCAVIQRLLPKCGADGRMAVFEVMLAEEEIQTLIREGRYFQMPSALENRKGSGMQTMDEAILSAYMKSDISAETAIACAYDRRRMEQKMKIYEI